MNSGVVKSIMPKRNKSPNAFKKALELALTIDRVERESPINSGQLLLLCAIAAAKSIDRHELLDQETHEKPTVDKRIKYLLNKKLIDAGTKERYRDSAKFKAAPLGLRVYKAFIGSNNHSTLVDALNKCLSLPIARREEPINVGQLCVLFYIVNEPRIELSTLVSLTGESKQTIRSRLSQLENKDLVLKHPDYNAGGSGSPNYYTPTSGGVSVIKVFFVAVN